MNATLRTASLLFVLLTTSCALAVVGAGAAAGIWAHDEYSDSSGEIVLGASPEEIFMAANAVATERGVKIKRFPEEMRVEFTMLEPAVDVSMVVIVVPDSENAGLLRVRATEILRGRAEIARELALEVQSLVKNRR
ncbi:MAG TPA: hypothetical protein VGC54_09025 [Planctomycetota bacterium]